MKRLVFLFFFFLTAATVFVNKPSALSPSPTNQTFNIQPTVPPFPTMRPLPTMPPLKDRQDFREKQQIFSQATEVKETETEATVYIDSSFTGVSDGTEGSPYKDIYTAISSSDVDVLHLLIKAGTYDEYGHDLINSAKAKK